MLQAARADAVLSVLIFLHLLPCDPKAVAELLSAHSEHHPAHPNTGAHVFIDGAGGPFEHYLFHDCKNLRVYDCAAAPHLVPVV